MGLVGGLVFIFMWGLSGYGVPFWPEEAEVTNEMPFNSLIGRELVTKVSIQATAWNDFPDKEKILSVTLDPPPGQARNRFVSYQIGLEKGQRIKLLSAWSNPVLFGTVRHYKVSLPGAELPANVPIKLKVKSDGIPDPEFYELIPQ